MTVSLLSLQGVCQYFPQGQARNFMDAIMKTLACTNEERAQAAGDWMIVFLETRGKEIRPEVRETLVPLGLDFSLLAVVLPLVWAAEMQPERGAEGTAAA